MYVNLYFTLLTKSHDDDVTQTKTMFILSTGTSTIYSVLYRNIKKKETAVILHCNDQLPPKFARVHHLIHLFDVNH